MDIDIIDVEEDLNILEEIKNFHVNLEGTASEKMTQMNENIHLLLKIVLKCHNISVAVC